VSSGTFSTCRLNRTWGSTQTLCED
jgi:hypothetical protein